MGASGRRRVSMFAVVATIAAGLAAAVAPLPGADLAGAVTKPTLRMAVLGDSYSAGVGVGVVGTGCDRDRLAWGPRAYNELLGSRYTLGSLKFVACSGYTSDQITANQLGAVTSSTNMVTLTAGGNDIGFGGKVMSCVLRNCPSSLLSLSASSSDRPRQTWAGLRDKLADLYVRIRQRMAPGGKLFVATYPIPFAEVDRDCAQFLPDEQVAANALVNRLDDTILEAVSQANARLGGWRPSAGRVFVVDWRSAARARWHPYRIPSGITGAGTAHRSMRNPAYGLCNAAGQTAHVQGVLLSPVSYVNSFHPGTTGYWYLAERFALADRLLSAPVPSLCGHPAGRLVGGSLPGVPDNFGGVWIDQGRALLADFDGNGNREIVVEVTCSQGGVGWPPTLILYDSGLAVKDQFGFSRLRSLLPSVVDFRGSYEDFEIASGRVRAYQVAGRDGDAGCCPSLPFEISLDVVGGRFAAFPGRAYTEGALRDAVVGAANRRSGTELSALGVGSSTRAALLDAVARRGRHRVSAPAGGGKACNGQNDPGFVRFSSSRFCWLAPVSGNCLWNQLYFSWEDADRQWRADESWLMLMCE